MITAGIGQVTSGERTPGSAIWLLIFAFLAESLGYWVKERQELILTIAVRQLTYRRFRDIFSRSSHPPEAHGHVLTYPGQISQFAFVVDFAVSTVQIIAFLAASLALYGASGAIAALLITGLVFVSVRLINLVGRLWEQYVALEGERRQWIQRVANALPRGQSIPSWGTALDKVASIRNTEEQLLHRRVPLQILNGFLGSTNYGARCGCGSRRVALAIRSFRYWNYFGSPLPVRSGAEQHRKLSGYSARCANDA